MSSFKAFTEKHENIWQIVKFTFLSCIAAVVELVSLNIMLAALKSYTGTEVHWFVFNYTEADGGLCNFIAFIVSTTLAQIVSYVVNRKKTFNANNNVVFSVVMYIIMEIFIICLQIWSGPLLTGVLYNAGVPAVWASNLSKFSWMFMSFIVVFLMDKFVIMRNTGDEDDDKVDYLCETGEVMARMSEDDIHQILLDADATQKD